MITYAVINEEIAIESLFDRVVIVEDKFRSGYECITCNGLKHTGVQCKYCKGTTFHKGKPENGACPDCSTGGGPLARSLGYEICPSCKGTGSSSIVMPEEKEDTRPTIGTIQSIGSLVKTVQVGDRVGYTNFSGHIFDIGRKDKIKIRILKESEILFRLHGVAKNKSQDIENAEFKELKEVGIE
jgi:co-chaperonin GroES (HSP10)